MSTKFLTILISAILLLCSCSNEVDPESVQDDRVPITIQAYAQGSVPNGNAQQTRSVGTQITNLNNGFFLYAETTQDGETSVLVNDKSVTYEDGKFELDTPIYWPKDENQEVCFYACAAVVPYSKWVPGEYEFSDVKDIYNFASESDLPNNFSYSFTSDYYSDYLIGYTAAKRSSGTTVNLSLSHMTSLLKFAFRGDSYFEFEITDLTLTSPKGGFFDPVTKKYTRMKESIETSVISEESPLRLPIDVVNYTVLKDGAGDVETYLLYPDYVTVNVSYNIYNAGSVVDSYTKEATIDIHSGDFMTLNFTLPYDNAPMSFEVSASTWGSDSIIEGDPDPEPTVGTYVDLGLPSGTLWHKSNLSGLYYWGSTTSGGSPVYGADSDNSNSVLTKYCTDPDYLAAGAVIDYKSKLDISDDPAQTQLGGFWLVPSQSQITELVNYCYWALVTEESGHDPGYYVFKVDDRGSAGEITTYYVEDPETLLYEKGESVLYDIESDVYIFLPATEGTDGYYLSNGCYNHTAYCLQFDGSENVDGYYSERNRAQLSSVRPVWKP